MNTQTIQNKQNRVLNEVLNAVTHGIGTLLSIVALVFLIMKGVRSEDTVHLIAYLVYGISMIMLFLASTLYHSFSFTRYSKVFRYIDHASIYLLIAGTYTPFGLIALAGTAGNILIGVVWSLAAIGLILKIFFVGKFNGLSTILYLAMGWLAVFLIKPMYVFMGTNGIILLVLGGLCYSLGTIFYSNKKFGIMHVIWHLFVLAGAAFHYFTILLYV